MAVVSQKVIYPKLSFQIVGAAFRAFNTLGYGLRERDYQRAFAQILERDQIPFRREESVILSFESHPLSRYFLDFIVDGKIVVELKTQPKLDYVHTKQVMGCLAATKCQLAILIYFTRNGVKYRRVIRANS